MVCGGTECPRRVGLRVVSGYFVIFPSRAAACNRKLGTARLGLFEDYPLPFRQRERVYFVCISELSARKTKRRVIFQPLGAWKLPQRVGRREKSAARGVLPYPMSVARYRPPRTADFSRKEVGRRYLPVCSFRTRAGATHVQAHTLPGWAPRLRDSETGQSGKCTTCRALRFSSGTPFLPLLIARGIIAFCCHKVMARAWQARSGAVPAKNLHPSGRIRASGFAGNLG